MPRKTKPKQTKPTEKSTETWPSAEIVDENKSVAKSPTEKKDLMPWVIAVVAVLLIFNQIQLFQLTNPLTGGAHAVTSAGLKLSNKPGTIVGPQLNADGRTTHIREWPTISETPKKAPTGDATQDAINNVIPTGTPSYVLEGPGHEKIQGVTFDDPISSQKIWGSLLGSRRFGSDNAIQLTPEEEARWSKIVNLFTCDYCCGGPGQVTHIANCGCAHSYGWQGMAKFFIKYYGDKYTDEQIMGEMTKWKGLWYPKGMIQDYLKFASGQGGEGASLDQLDKLPGMVGGC